MHIEYFKCNLIFICIVTILGHIRIYLFIKTYSFSMLITNPTSFVECSHPPLM